MAEKTKEKSIMATLQSVKKKKSVVKHAEIQAEKSLVEDEGGCITGCTSFLRRRPPHRIIHFPAKFPRKMFEIKMENC